MQFAFVVLHIDRRYHFGIWLDDGRIVTIRSRQGSGFGLGRRLEGGGLQAVSALAKCPPLSSSLPPPLLHLLVSLSAQQALRVWGKSVGSASDAIPHPTGWGC